MARPPKPHVAAAQAATKLIGGDSWATASLSAAVLAAFLAVNLIGAKLSGEVELTVVAIKLAILALFAGVGMLGVHPGHFVPVFDRGLTTPLAAVALIFVAYEGFELIPNAIDEMDDPDRNLGRAIVIAIALPHLECSPGLTCCLI